MKFAFHVRQPFQKTMLMANAIKSGAAAYGDDVRIIEGYPNGVEDVDGLILFGIGGESGIYWDAYRKAGKPVVFIDKGYSRMPYFRVAIDGFQPTRFVRRKSCTDDRLRRLDLRFDNLAPKGDYILFDGASNKYCLWHRLGYWVDWGQHIVDIIRQNSDRPVIYRPRPSHNTPTALRGCTLSTGPLEQDLQRAYVVVTHGGNIAWDAAIAGVPVFSIDPDSFAAPIAETSWESVGTPRLVKAKKLHRWASSVAYCQYTIDEFANGIAWNHIVKELRGGFDED